MTVQLTKFTHACVRLDDGERRLVLDPGAFSEIEQALDGVDDVLITHEHADHVEPGRLAAAAAANTSLRVFGPSSLAGPLAALGDAFTPVAPGDSFTAGGFAIEAVGGQHAVIHPRIPVIANVGFVVEGGIYHPGDSFFVPTQPVSVLLLPLHAPWSKASEVVDFAIAVRAPRAYAVHDSLLTAIGAGVVNGQLTQLAGPFGVDYAQLDAAATVTV